MGGHGANRTGYTQRVKNNRKKRILKVFIDLPNQQPFQIKFERKSDGKIRKRVAITCEQKNYTEYSVFNARVPYILEFESNFIGKIKMSSIQGKEIEIPVDEVSEEAISFMLTTTEEIEESEKDGVTVFKPDLKTEEHRRVNISTSLQEGEYTVTDEMQSEFEKLMKNDTFKAVAIGLFSDGSQVFYNKDISFKELKGLKFDIRMINGYKYIVFKDWASTRAILTAPKYGINNPKVASLVVEKANVFTKTSIINGTWVTIVIASILTTVDYLFIKKGKDLSDLLISIFAGVVKAVLALIVAGWIIATYVTVGTGILVFLATAGIALAIGAVLNIADESLGATDALKRIVNKMEQNFNDKIENMKDTSIDIAESIIGSGERMAKKALNSFLKDIEDSISDFLNPARYLKIDF